LRTIAASRGLGVAHRGVNRIGLHERSLAADGRLACRFGARDRFAKRHDVCAQAESWNPN